MLNSAFLSSSNGQKQNSKVKCPVEKIGFLETYEMIKREKYMEPIREFYDGDLIKVITGIRRCGKSVILKQIIEEKKRR